MSKASKVLFSFLVVVMVHQCSAAPMSKAGDTKQQLSLQQLQLIYIRGQIDKLQRNVKLLGATIQKNRDVEYRKQRHQNRQQQLAVLDDEHLQRGIVSSEEDFDRSQLANLRKAIDQQAYIFDPEHADRAQVILAEEDKWEEGLRAFQQKEQQLLQAEREKKAKREKELLSGRMELLQGMQEELRGNITSNENDEWTAALTAFHRGLESRENDEKARKALHAGEQSARDAFKADEQSLHIDMRERLQKLQAQDIKRQARQYETAGEAFKLQGELTSWQKLSTLKKIIFSRPEFVGPFWDPTTSTIKGPAISKAFRCLPQRILEEVLEAHYKLFESKTLNVDSEQWLGDNFDVEKERYVQKLTVPDNSTICFMGDLHGSMHSLMRNLLRLQKLGYLNDTMKLTQDNFYMVFLGDYVDRGRWSTEIITILMRLKSKNWNQVVLIAGNHESEGLAKKYGFLKELQGKYGESEGDKLLTEVSSNFFKALPVALFIQCGNTYVQCCHGGIATQYKPKDFLELKDKKFQNVGADKKCKGLFWSDFCSGDRGKLVANEKRGYKKIEEAIIADGKATKKYLGDNNLAAIIRAHQDDLFGLKLFSDIRTDREDYPVHWTNVVKRKGVSGNTFPMNLIDHHPVFTFSSAVEGKGFNYDCFGLVNAGHIWNKWMLEVYEFFLGRNGEPAKRSRKLVDIPEADEDLAERATERVTVSEGPQDDIIPFRWTSPPQGK